MNYCFIATNKRSKPRRVVYIEPKVDIDGPVSLLTCDGTSIINVVTTSKYAGGLYSGVVNGQDACYMFTASHNYTFGYYSKTCTYGGTKTWD